MEAYGPFTQKLWQGSLPIFNQITNCQFLKQLTKGTLKKENFAHFLTQDILYLKKDAEALGMLSKRAKCENEKVFFSKLERDGLEIEYVLENEYLKYFELEAASFQSPAFLEYSEFILDQSTNSPYEMALIALLPCFWLYSSMKIHTIEQVVDNNPYQKFIDTYSGDEYRSYTKQFLQIVEKHGQTCKDENQAIETFKRGMQYELNIFIEAIKIETPKQ
ncbi:TenA family protein [Ancylomarina sp. 16SWW S1-10-2]|uniref:TenA family protein n=1 Tax=Ancylomarina sp. 16SWW S1-10-2 TaxID=2499681 RepID=UPI0012AE9407|nr:TenA family protein [Ancylomarina sp. 16SWW S1-10-2]MRT92749.1 transcriptional regulator [Ancylomarina sp. 16SWW S1-10-2]